MKVRLTPDKLSLDEAYAAVRSPERGGVALFCGDVRASEDGRPIGGIEYKAYETMAQTHLERLAAQAEARHGACVAVFHRLGVVPAGESSVIVAAGAAHRAEAFAACRETIDGLKEIIPIWKTHFVPAST